MEHEHAAALGELPLIQNVVRQTLPASFCFGAHSHRNVELLLVAEGSCSLTVWKETLSLRAGEFIVLFSDAVHTFTVNGEGPCSFWQMHASPSLFSAEGCACFYGLAPGELPPLLAELSRECALEELFSGLYRNLLAGQIAFLLERAQSAGATCCRFSPNPYVRKSLDYLSANCRRKLSLNEVAAACGISRRYLSLLFYEDTHTTVADYTNLLRVNRAVDLLRDTALSVGEISEHLGFSSVQYFSKLFKDVTGFSPRAIRESFLPRQSV